MPQPEAKTNPLARRPVPQSPPMHPMKAHAHVWQQVGKIPPEELPDRIKKVDGNLPIMGELAGNPNVTSKDVIKAASQAAANGTSTPTEAVQFISAMPDDPKKLQGWLKGMYSYAMSAAVHMKAAQMAGAQQAPAAPEPAPAPGSPPPPTSMTPGEAPQ
jgi:hypothetical protein